MSEGLSWISGLMSPTTAPGWGGGARRLAVTVTLETVVSVSAASSSGGAVLVFLLIYFFLRHAEAFYHHPSSAGARRWSSLAKWRLREFNELPHLITHRCAAPRSAVPSIGDPCAAAASPSSMYACKGISLPNPAVGLPFV